MLITVQSFKKVKPKGDIFFLRKAVVDTTNPDYNVYKYLFAQKDFIRNKFILKDLINSKRFENYGT